MELKELVDEGVKCIRREKRLIGKMMKYEIDGDSVNFNALKPYYKILKEKTDLVVQELLGNFAIEDTMNEITSRINFDEDVIHDEVDLAGFVDCAFLNKVGQALFDMDAGCFVEENCRYLYSLYRWCLDNENYNDKVREALYFLMYTRLASSQVIRSYYSGDNENAEKVSSPDAVFGRLSANMYALQAYYCKLNELINESNCHEMFAGLTDFDTFFAREKMLEIEFAAICSQLESRDIEFPNVETPMSDFTIKVLQNASNMYENYKKSSKAKSYKKTIYL